MLTVYKLMNFDFKFLKIQYDCVPHKTYVCI